MDDEATKLLMRALYLLRDNERVSAETWQAMREKLIAEIQRYLNLPTPDDSLFVTEAVQR